MNLGRAEQFVSEVVFLRAAQAAGHDFAIGRADHQAAGHLQHVPAAVDLQLPPQLERAAQQRHVGGMFEVRKSNDSRFAVARAVRVRRLKLFDAKHALAARSQMRSGGTAHAAKADDDRVKHRRVLSAGYDAKRLAGLVAALVEREEHHREVRQHVLQLDDLVGRERLVGI